MAELALGCISLGIQVGQGIAAYLGAIRSRDEEIRSVKQQAESLELVVREIDHLVTQNEHLLHKLSPGTLQCLQACENGLKTLDSLGNRLSGRPLSAISGLREKTREGIKLLKYPYARSDLMKVRDQLGRSLASLQLAAQYLNL